jgi:hypothetical protein
LPSLDHINMSYAVSVASEESHTVGHAYFEEPRHQHWTSKTRSHAGDVHGRNKAFDGQQIRKTRRLSHGPPLVWAKCC